MINETKFYVDLPHPSIQQVVSPFHFSISLNYITRKFTVHPNKVALSISTIIDCVTTYCNRQEVMNNHHGQN